MHIEVELKLVGYNYSSFIFIPQCPAQILFTCNIRESKEESNAFTSITLTNKKRSLTTATLLIFCHFIWPCVVLTSISWSFTKMMMMSKVVKSILTHSVHPGNISVVSVCCDVTPSVLFAHHILTNTSNFPRHRFVLWKGKWSKVSKIETLSPKQNISRNNDFGTWSAYYRCLSVRNL